MRSEPRLALVLPDLAAHLATLTPEIQRSLARDMVDLVAERRPIIDARYTAARVALMNSKYGEGRDRDRLLDLVEELDHVQWGLQERVDERQSSHGNYQGAFADARAANALWCALDENALWACLEAAYESYAGLDEDEDALRACLAESKSDDTSSSI